MAADQREWTAPAPLRALTWWPPVAFVLGALAPEIAPASITAAGLLLAAVGALGRRRRALPPPVELPVERSLRRAA